MALPTSPIRTTGGPKHIHAHRHTGVTTLLSLPNPPSAFILLVSGAAITLTLADGSTINATFPINVKFDLQITGLQLASGTTQVLLLW